MSTFPEGYGLGPGPRHPFQTYICNRCGAVITSKTLHDEWHVRIAPAEIDIETETLTSDSPETGPWERVADIPEAWDRFEDRFGDQWRRRYSPSGEQIWETYSFPNFCWIPVPLRDGCAPFRLSIRKDI